MASAWGSSWASAWGNSWGAISAASSPVSRRRRGKYKTYRPPEPEKQEQAIAALAHPVEIEIPPNDGLLGRDVISAKEFAEIEVKRLLDFMEQEAEEVEQKKRRRRKAAYLLLLN